MPAQMHRSRRRVVSKHIKRQRATDVRHAIELAQVAVVASSINRTTARMQIARAQQVLDRYGVATGDKITQSRRRWRGRWIVVAEPAAVEAPS